MTALVIMIPSRNEESTIGQVIREIPRRIPSVDRVFVSVTGHGSRNRTAEVAREARADFILSHARNQVLAVIL